MRLFWGFLLLFLGVVYLGNNFNWWSFSDFAFLWVYWPILLIILGIAIITRKMRFGWVIVLLSLLISLGFIFYMAINHRGPVLSINENSSTKNTSFSESIDLSIKKIILEVDTGAANLTLNGTDDYSVTGNLDSTIAEPTVEKNINNGVETIKVSTGKNFFGWHSGEFKNNLKISVYNNIPVELSVNAGASQLNLDLSQILLYGLNIDAGASKINVKFGEKGQDRAITNIDAGASSIDLEYPNPVGVNIDLKSSLVSKQLKDFVKIESGQYQTSNFSNSFKKLLINVKAGASSLSVVGYEM